MLYIHLKTIQVKCNFCMEWMTLYSNLKSNIHVCDSCLIIDNQSNSLQTLSSNGQFYHINLIKHKNPLQSQKQRQLKQFYAIKQEIQQLQNASNQQNNYFSQNIFHKKIIQAKTQNDNLEPEIKQRWNQIKNLISFKQELSISQLRELKNLINKNIFNNQNQINSVNDSSLCQKTNNTCQTPQFLFEKNNSLFQDQKLKITFFKQNHIPDQSFQNKSKSITFSKNFNRTTNQRFSLQINKQNLYSSKQKLHFNSPRSKGLKQKNLNSTNICVNKSINLKQNNYTSGKRIHTSFFDESLILRQNQSNTSAFMPQYSSRSNCSKLSLNGITKRLNKQQLKKKDKISKYIQRNYESESLGRLMSSLILEAYIKTSRDEKSIELISYDLNYIDMRCYLQVFDWEGIEMIKLVKTKLSDIQLKILIDFIIEHKLQIKVLVLTNNYLTEAALQYIVDKNPSHLNQIYLAKNKIIKSKVRQQLLALQNHYSLFI